MPASTEPVTRNRLRQLRREQDLAIFGLAVLARVSPTIIGGIEKWDYRPGPAIRQRLAQALSVTEQEIWPDDL